MMESRRSMRSETETKSDWIIFMKVRERVLVVEGEKVLSDSRYAESLLGARYDTSNRCSC